MTSLATPSFLISSLRFLFLTVSLVVLSPTAMAGDFLGLKRSSKAEAPALPPAQQPIERIPGFSSPTYTGHFDSQGQHVITQIDRNSDTVKGWIKEGVISEDQIKKIEAGQPVPVELPDAH